MSVAGTERNGESSATGSPRSKGRWLWFFGLLAVLSACAVAIPWVYNVQQQLRPEKLTAARSIWEQRGAQDYDLEYLSKEDERPGADATYGPEVESVSIHVRQGRIESATRNGQPLGPEQAQPYRVEGVFDQIQSYLERDGQYGQPRTYAHALFDKKDGHPVHYVRRVMGSRRRLEVFIELNAPGEEPRRKLTFPERG